MTRAEAEALVARVTGHAPARIRVVMCVSGLVGDVLLDGRSALPETLSRLARAGLPLAEWDRSPGRIGTVARVRGRLTRVRDRYCGHGAGGAS